MIEEEKDEFNLDEALVRYEFWEVIVRIASFKYIQTGVFDSNAKACNCLLNEHFAPLISRNVLHTWQQWREKHLWKYKVNKLLELNMDNMRDLYLLISKLRDVQK